MPFTPAEIKHRLNKLQHHLANTGVDLAIINRNSDIFYYTGSFMPLYLIVPATGEPVMLARKAIDRIQREVTNIALEVFYSMRDLIGILQKHSITNVKRIGLTLDSISYSSAQRFLKLFEDAQLADISWDIRTLRIAKSEAEIEIIAKAGEIVGQIPRIIRDEFKPGMSEVQLSAIIENFLRLNGHGGILRCRREGSEMSFGLCSAGTNTLGGTKFEGICMGTGLSAATPYGGNFDVIPKEVPVLLDYSLTLEGYHIDQSRMMSWGTPSDEVLNAYDAMVKVEKALIEKMKPGACWEDLYKDSVNLAAQLGYSEGFMGLGIEKVRFVGHGVGLELDEPPFLAPKMKDTLAEGMTIAIEPKVALPGIGIVGIEDTVVIRKAGAEILTICSNEFIVID